MDTPVGRSGLPGAAALRRHGPRLGIQSVRDLLTYLPNRYEDLRQVLPLEAIASVPDGELATVRVTVVTIRVEQGFRRRVQRTVALLRDDTGEVEAVWFGRRFIERRLRAGDRVVASGKVRARGWSAVLEGPEFQPDDGSVLLHAGRIVPIYRLTRGIGARQLRTAVRAGLDTYGPYREYLPAARRAGLMGIGEAVEAAHFPDGFAQRDAALRRLAHDELLALQLGMAARRRQRRIERGSTIRVPEDREQRLRGSVTAGLTRRVGRAVDLTPDQSGAMSAIREDIAREVPMLRLLQGDVGSGKTAVAAYAMGLAADVGRQAALLAPTDLLARQLADATAELLADAGTPVTLLTGSLSGAGRRSALEGLASGQAQVVVGTHALLQEAVSYADLGLVVIDEQHRFGVAQREALASKGSMPHVLLMTATPIPRTLGQVLYADLDVSDLRTPPAGRERVKTGIRSAAKLAGTWDRVREEAAAGHRAFVVVPHIEGGPADGVGDEGPAAGPSLPADASTGLAAATGAEEVASRLRQELAPLRVGLIHGRLRSADREDEMRRFRDGELDVLVGTTVLEVGVDVPDATMMVILSAERFGLSQLHQLRGRVGRGTAASFCVLVADVPEDSVAWQRLTTVAGTHDGFALAEKDWQLRGEGDVLGLAQSGLPRLRVASLARPDHRELAMTCRALAEELLGEDGVVDASMAELRDELAGGWLAAIAAGEAASEESMGA
ncbi:ATP-dependent DNA helicase RecG [soil metagenome]